MELLKWNDRPETGCACSHDGIGNQKVRIFGDLTRSAE
jgi:hypothetical protein